MPLTKTQKQKIIEDLKEKISKQKIIIFADFAGLKVKDFASLRKKLKKEESEIKVAKKTLVQITFQNFDIQNLRGQIALVFGYKDEISPAKIAYQFSQENPNLKILGGFFENQFIEAEKIVELAQLPTREELLSRLVGSISAPISNFVNVLEANIRNFVYIISQIKPST